jgi:hypothetical protein
MRMRIRARLLILSVLSGLALRHGGSASADVLDDIKPGEWYEAPNSKLSQARPNPLPPGASGISAVMAAWSGGAYDGKRDRLIVWGGGHTDYAGNEIYVFDIATLKWMRTTNPSVDVAGVESSGIYPDNLPRARHTYNYITYVANIDRFCTMGGAGLYPSGQTNDEVTRCFDFAKGAWETKSLAPTANIGTLAAYDAGTGKVWSLAGGQDGSFASWDGASDKWKKYGENNGFVPYSYTPAIGQGKMVIVGGGKISYFDLAHPEALTIDLKTGGDADIVDQSNPGFAYDAKANLFVAWNGGKNVYGLDLGKSVWTKVAPASTNKVTPTAAQPNGTYGRFQYIASRDLFVGVNSVDEDVFFFRLPADLKGSTMGIRSRPFGKGRSGLLEGSPLQYQGGKIKLPLEGSGKFRIYDLNQRLVRQYDRTTLSASSSSVEPGFFEINPDLPSGAYILVQSAPDVDR